MLNVNNLTSTTTNEETHQNDRSQNNLLPSEKNEQNLVVTSWNGLDPLSAALSSSNKPIFHEQIEINDLSTQKKSLFIESDFIQWSDYKARILNKFNTVEKLSIKSSFFNEKIASKPFLNLSQKVKDRVEQLDDFEEGSMHEMFNLSQPEYIKRIEELNLTLNDAWENDQKVKALKIAIQCAKQLSSTNGIHFYPSKFVLITDILNTFGQLVYNRLLNKVNHSKEDENFMQETCKNWFYKISSIRELLPRFYIEASILKIYSFLIDKSKLFEKYEQIIVRLTMMIRGIGDPLVAVYCRAYLCRVAIELHPESKNIFVLNYTDILASLNMVKHYFY